MLFGKRLDMFLQVDMAEMKQEQLHRDLVTGNKPQVGPKGRTRFKLAETHNDPGKQRQQTDAMLTWCSPSLSHAKVSRSTLAGFLLRGTAWPLCRTSL